MSTLFRRVTVLEGHEPSSLSPALKAWLGWPLTVAEQQALDAGSDESEMTDIDTSRWSQEAKAWLGVE